MPPADGSSLNAATSAPIGLDSDLESVARAGMARCEERIALCRALQDHAAKQLAMDAKLQRLVSEKVAALHRSHNRHIEGQTEVAELCGANAAVDAECAQTNTKEAEEEAAASAAQPSGAGFEANKFGVAQAHLQKKQEDLHNATADIKRVQEQLKQAQNDLKKVRKGGSADAASESRQLEQGQCLVY